MQKILVPIDFSETSKNAAIFAAKLANKNNAYLHFIHVYRLPLENIFVPSSMMDHLVFEREREALEAFENKVMSWLKEESINPLSFKIKYGSPLDIIIQQAQDQNMDLIIMGTKGADDVLDKIFGSITSNVIKGSDVPVLTIPQNAQFENFRKIAYATNFDENDIVTIKKLDAFASKLGVKIAFVHIVEENSDKGYIQKGIDFIAQSKASGLKNVYLQKTVNKNVIDGLEVFIVENEVDAIAMLTHSRSIFDKLTKGSITQKLALKNHIPLLAYH